MRAVKASLPFKQTCSERHWGCVIFTLWVSDNKTFLAGDDQPWAEQFATEQQEQAQQRQLTPEEQKALRGAQPDDPLDDKAALSWVRQFNEEAAKPTVNFGMLAVLAHALRGALQRHFTIHAEQFAITVC